MLSVDDPTPTDKIALSPHPTNVGEISVHIAGIWAGSFKKETGWTPRADTQLIGKIACDGNGKIITN